MKTVPALIAISVLALAAPTLARSPSAAPQLTPYAGQRYEAAPEEALRDEPAQGRIRTGPFKARIHDVPPATDPVNPMSTVPPPATPRTRARDRLQTQTQFENLERAITERSRQGVARPSLGIPGQQPWGVPSQPSPGVPGQQRPVWQPKQ